MAVALRHPITAEGPCVEGGPGNAAFARYVLTLFALRPAAASEGSDGLLLRRERETEALGGAERA